MSYPTSHAQKVWWTGLLAATAINCLAQIAWFWRFRAHNITMDGINYIGLARHLVEGNFTASVHGYWSPLFSWIIAAGAPFTKDFTFLGRLATILSFLACLPPLYALTLRLWRSHLAAALAVFWFSMARGIVAMAVGSILADFVLTAFVLLYFLLLLEALRLNRPSTWTAVGAAHALAFLAKAIAMPWLAISTFLAAAVSNARAPRRLISSLLLAFLLPGVVWLSWGMALRAKYGAFTTGYQLRANLMINWHRRLTHYPLGAGLAFQDMSSDYDSYMVGETSWSSLQKFNLREPGLPGMMVEAEIQNVPQAVKEIVILLTPGGVVAFAAMLVLLLRRREVHRAEAAFLCIALLSTSALILAYCMLVFDGRYVIPIVPVLIAICCPMLLPSQWVPAAPVVAPWVRRTALGLFAASTIFFSLYWASPYRTVDRDFEASCYQAADRLRSLQSAGTLVSIGNGPYPEHGVGFEVGPYVAYLAGWRLVGGNTELPDATRAGELAAAVVAARPDAVAVWGSPTGQVYKSIIEKIERATGSASISELAEPLKGEVGTLILISDGKLTPESKCGGFSLLNPTETLQAKSLRQGIVKSKSSSKGPA
jgi:4-amino-4-deoxy-L-arabinose transferase-like glycosyltransferase